MEAQIFINIEKTAEFILQKSRVKPKIAIVLGSGLGPLVELIKDPIRIPYQDIPHFAQSTVTGHAGELVLGWHAGADLICMNGRFHYYEGYDFQRITFPIRVIRQLGAEILILTNAAGGVNTSYNPGDLMLLRDHINLMGGNPLRGPNIDMMGPRFPDMTEVYSGQLREMVRKLSPGIEIDVQEGVYAALSGPNYETPAEIRMLRKLGVDAVGMSTVPEAIVARHMGMPVVAISCITNMAAGMTSEPLSHEEVTRTAKGIQTNFTRLISSLIATIQNDIDSIITK